MNKTLEHVLTKKRTIVRDGVRYSKIGYKAYIQNGCYLKKKFKTLSAAENHILREFPEDFKMLPYKCKNCNRFHIGHTRKKNEKG